MTMRLPLGLCAVKTHCIVLWQGESIWPEYCCQNKHHAKYGRLDTLVQYIVLKPLIFSALTCQYWVLNIGWPETDVSTIYSLSHEWVCGRGLMSWSTIFQPTTREATYRRQIRLRNREYRCVSDFKFNSRFGARFAGYQIDSCSHIDPVVKN